MIYRYTHHRILYYICSNGISVSYAYICMLLTRATDGLTSEYKHKRQDGGNINSWAKPCILGQYLYTGTNYNTCKQGFWYLYIAFL